MADTQSPSSASPAPAPAQRPASAQRPVAARTKSVDSLREDYEELAAQVTITNPGDPKYPQLRLDKKAAAEAWHEAWLDARPHKRK